MRYVFDQARRGDVAGDFLGVLKDRQPPLGLSGELLFGHQVYFS